MKVYVCYDEYYNYIGDWITSAQRVTTSLDTAKTYDFYEEFELDDPKS